MADDNPILKDTIRTKDDNGNEVIVYAETSDDQVKGLDKYVKSLSFGDGNLTVTNGDGTTYKVHIGTQGIENAVILLSNVDHTITVTNSDETTYDLEIDNELISDEEILILFDIEDSKDKYY